MSSPLLSTATRYFLEVARTGSITEAAGRVHVAPSAVSRQVAKLEDNLGCALFERQPRGMVLTDAGERLAAWVRSTMQETDRVAEDLLGLASQQAGRIHMACTEGLTAGFMPDFMAAFRAEHPGSGMHLKVGAPDEIGRWLLRGEADIGVKFAVAPEKGLRIEHNRRAPIMALVSPSHPLARLRRVTVAELVRHPLALPDSGTTVRQVLDLCCSLQGLHYDVIYSGNFPALLALAIKGEAPTLSSYLSAAHAVRAGSLLALPIVQPQFEQRRVQVLSLQGRVLSPLLQACVAALAHALAAQAQPARRGKLQPRKS
ncbi:MAG: LysR family transcriptional regulator [Ramlibacter sp.]|nr:LysR family transcriptional regulator [Ramlibacter sp.]